MSNHGEDGTLSRRRLIGGAAAGAGALLSASALAAQSSAASVADPSKVQGNSPSALGSRSSFENPARLPFAGVVSATPLQDLHGTITPADLHFERHHAGIPAIDPGRHELLIHGMVERPLKFSLADLKRLPSVTRICFIECSGNLYTGMGEKSTPQILCGLTSQSEWTGVALSTLLREAGVRSKAKWLLAEGGDAALMTRSITMQKALDDALVVYAQNGEAMRPAQGYPMRLLLPGWEGNTSIKWLRRIEVSDAPFMTREETSKYTEPLKDGTVRQFSVVMDARSVITHPAYPVALEKGWHEIRGIAWSGRGRIQRVEVSSDGGKKWRRARLQQPVLPMAHARFALPWRWDGNETELLSRAIDETGYVQPTQRQLQEARGIGSGFYHRNGIIGWRVAGDGQMYYAPQL